MRDLRGNLVAAQAAKIILFQHILNYHLVANGVYDYMPKNALGMDQ